jgi:hypothetical protein
MHVNLAERGGRARVTLELEHDVLFGLNIVDQLMFTGTAVRCVSTAVLCCTCLHCTLQHPFMSGGAVRQHRLLPRNVFMSPPYAHPHPRPHSQSIHTLLTATHASPHPTPTEFYLDLIVMVLGILSLVFALRKVRESFTMYSKTKAELTCVSCAFLHCTLAYPTTLTRTLPHTFLVSCSWIDGSPLQRLCCETDASLHSWDPAC